MTDAATPAADKPRIRKVSVDLDLGLFAFAFDDGIVEHIQIRDETEVPTVAAFLAALNAEVEKFGRPQKVSRDSDAHTPPDNDR